MAGPAQMAVMTGVLLTAAMSVSSVELDVLPAVHAQVVTAAAAAQQKKRHDEAQQQQQHTSVT